MTWETLSAVLSALAAIVTIVRATLVRNAIYEKEKIIKKRLLNKYFIFKDKIGNNIHFHIYEILCKKKKNFINFIKRLLDIGDYGITVVYASITGGYVDVQRKVVNLCVITINGMRIEFAQDRAGMLIAKIEINSINPDKVWVLICTVPSILERLWKESM